MHTLSSLLELPYPFPNVKLNNLSRDRTDPASQPTMIYARIGRDPRQLEFISIRINEVRLTGDK